MDFNPRLNMLLCTCINPGTQKLRLAGALRCAAPRCAVQRGWKAAHGACLPAALPSAYAALPRRSKA